MPTHRPARHPHDHLLDRDTGRALARGCITALAILSATTLLGYTVTWLIIR